MLHILAGLQGLCARSSRNDDGATAIEYALVAVLVAGVILAVLPLVGADAVNSFEFVENGLGGNQNP